MKSSGVLGESGASGSERPKPTRQGPTKNPAVALLRAALRAEGATPRHPARQDEGPLQAAAPHAIHSCTFVHLRALSSDACSSDNDIASLGSVAGRYLTEPAHCVTVVIGGFDKRQSTSYLVQRRRISMNGVSNLMERSPADPKRARA
jgi:hypothetical protein